MTGTGVEDSACVSGSVHSSIPLHEEGDAFMTMAFVQGMLGDNTVALGGMNEYLGMLWQALKGVEYYKLSRHMRAGVCKCMSAHLSTHVTILEIPGWEPSKRLKGNDKD